MKYDLAALTLLLILACGGEPFVDFDELFERGSEAALPDDDAPAEGTQTDGAPPAQGAAPTPTPPKPKPAAPTPPAKPQAPEATPPSPPSSRSGPSLSMPGDPRSLWSTYPPPAGAQRLPPDPFATWLGGLPVKPANVPVRTHDGRVVSGHRGARVIDFPMVSGNLQQCADALIRVRAEWLRETGGEIMYHATSGDPMPWRRWQAGERPYETNNRIAWRAGTSGGWESYLRAVMIWAGTASLAAHDTVAASTPRAGDMLVIGGFPGHAVMLLDVARRGDALFVLVGESYMPAMDFHVEPGPQAGWWSWSEGVRMPHWDMRNAPLRRWKR